MVCLCRTSVGENDVVHFPYCVVEVKLQVEQTPEWINSLLASGDKTAPPGRNWGNILC